VKSSRIQLPEPTNLALESVNPSDPTLRKPRGDRYRKTGKPDAKELARLKRTFDFGGLVPEVEGIQHYQCSACHKIFISRNEAIRCCEAGANQVSVCRKCLRRNSDCVCPPIFGLSARNALLAWIYRTQNMPGQALHHTVVNHPASPSVASQTKTQLIEICRVILTRNKDYELLQGDDARFMAELFQRHPEAEEKAGCGIVGFSVEPTSEHPGTRDFVVVRTDGTTEHFGWKKHCIDGWLPDPLPKALRKAIDPQTIAFRNASFAANPVQICPLTGEEITAQDECDVDHIPPQTFEALSSEWLRLHPNPVLIRSANGYGWRLAEPEERESWQSFHQANAQLRMVSRRARH